MKRMLFTKRSCASDFGVQCHCECSSFSLRSVLVFTASIVLLFAVGCTRESLGPSHIDAPIISLYIPAPERVETYSGATIDECLIDNAVVLTWGSADKIITGAEVVDIVLGNGTQHPTLRLRKLEPTVGEGVTVLCNLDPTGLDDSVAGCIGQPLSEAQKVLKCRFAGAGTTADMTPPLTMAGESVWEDPAPRVSMIFQCAKISVVLDPSLIEDGGSLSWAGVRHTYLDRIPSCSQWITASAPDTNNEEGALSQAGDPSYAPSADPMSYPGLYMYEAKQPTTWPSTDAFNYVLLRVSATEGSTAQYYCLTYDTTEPGGITKYNAFERGKHYVFYVKEIYKRGYDTIDEAIANPSDAVYDVEVSDDWSTNYDYNGQYGFASDRDTAYVWATNDAQLLYRFSWPRPAGDTNLAPTSSTIRLLSADRSEVIPVDQVQLLDKDLTAIDNNTFTFKDSESPSDGYPLYFRMSADSAPTDGMWLHVRCGNIEKFIPVGLLTFEVSAPKIDFNFQGGTASVDVTCSALMPDDSTGSAIGQLEWLAEFVDREGNVVLQPDWISNTTFSDGSIKVTVAHQKNSKVMTVDHDVVDYDLSLSNGYTGQRNTANCYIVHAAGTYSLPLVYGNAIKDGNTNESAYRSTAGISSSSLFLNPLIRHNGGNIIDPYIYNNSITISDAKLLWQDLEGMIDEASVKTDGQNLTFRVTDNIDYGNAVLAVFDNNGNIAWSWHIWCTDYDPYAADGTKTVENGIDPNPSLDMMLQNIGFCPGAIYEGRNSNLRLTNPNSGAVVLLTVNQIEYITRGNNPFFQWGRKDPMPAVLYYNANNVNKPTYGEYAWSNDSDVPSTFISTFQMGIQYPHRWYNNTATTYTYYNLWSMNNNGWSSPNTRNHVKTVYDPSPVGFIVPPSGAFNNFIRSNADDFNFGWNFYCSSQHEDTIFFSDAGYRRSTDGKGFGNGANGGSMYWTNDQKQTTSTAGSYSYRFSMYFTRSSILNDNPNSILLFGNSVRPVKEI